MHEKNKQNPRKGCKLDLEQSEEHAEEQAIQQHKQAKKSIQCFAYYTACNQNDVINADRNCEFLQTASFRHNVELAPGTVKGCQKMKALSMNMSIANPTAKAALQMCVISPNLPYMDWESRKYDSNMSGKHQERAGLCSFPCNAKASTRIGLVKHLLTLQKTLSLFVETSSFLPSWGSLLTLNAELHLSKRYCTRNNGLHLASLYCHINLREREFSTSPGVFVFRLLNQSVGNYHVY